MTNCFAYRKLTRLHLWWARHVSQAGIREAEASDQADAAICLAHRIRWSQMTGMLEINDRRRMTSDGKTAERGVLADSEIFIRMNAAADARSRADRDCALKMG